MLFHSTDFLLHFLPITWIGFLILVKFERYNAVLTWLTLASLTFYAWWNPSYVWLILISIGFNFTVSRLISPATGRSQKIRQRFLIAGLATNVIALGYYKYANFFIDNINGIFQAGFTIEKVVLPLAISFFDVR